MRLVAATLALSLASFTAHAQVPRLARLCDGRIDATPAQRVEACDKVLRSPRLRDRAKLYLNRGYAYYLQNKFSEALIDYDSAVAANPRDPTVYMARARAYAKLGNSQRAADDNSRAIALSKPKTAQDYSNRCTLYNDLKQYDQALADCNRALKLNRSYASAYHSRAMAHLGKGDRAAALADLRQAVKLKPHDIFINALVKLEKATVPPQPPPKSPSVADVAKRLDGKPTLTQAEITGLRDRLRKNWSPPMGRAGKSVVLEFRVVLSRDGTLAQRPILISASAHNDTVPVQAEAAIRALYASQPFDMLLPDHYELWKQMDLKFDPNDFR